jgi:hypothetical protein
LFELWTLQHIGTVAQQGNRTAHIRQIDTNAGNQLPYAATNVELTLVLKK